MGKVLFAVGIRKDWKKYMPGLVELAKREGGGVHVLETAAPIGTGEFTSNPVQWSDEYPSDPDARPSTERPAQGAAKTRGDDYPVEAPSPAVSPVNPADRPTAVDTGIAAEATNAYLEEMVAYLRASGIEAAWDWQPDFRREDLADYARRVGATTVALVRRGFLAELIQRNHIAALQEQGFSVVELDKA